MAYSFGSKEAYGSFRLRDRHYETRQQELADMIASNVEMVLESCEAAEEMHEVQPPASKKSRKAKYVCTYTEDDGVRRRLHPKMSPWYDMYIENPDTDNVQFQKLFRKRFRLPHAQFVELSAMVETSDYFSRWKVGSKDAVGDGASPSCLLLLCALRYLGRGWTFDDLSESTAISEEVIRTFLHRFIDFGSTVLYEQFVIMSKTPEEAKDHMGEFERAGLAGALGSTDATHVMLERVESRMRQAHLGFKMTHTARTYNLTVNHRRRILSTTHGHPARWNDKTLASFDSCMTGIRNGTILEDVVFELYDMDDNGIPFKQKYGGVWLLVDNGYLNWSTTVPPMKITVDPAEIRFSAWLESMRKDVECTFGILKGVGVY